MPGIGIDDMAQAYEDSREWSENPTTAAPTTARPTTEAPTTKEHKPQDYYDSLVATDRNLALKGTASHVGKHREGKAENLNDGIIDVWDNWDAVTVDNNQNPEGSFDIALDKAYDASTIDQVVVYWRTGTTSSIHQTTKCSLVTMENLEQWQMSLAQISQQREQTAVGMPKADLW
ncbi:MAG: hypothetical protein IJ883_03845 [Eubacterium sp.]|nr:hypothetical protein [Eubacterium sp.]